ncbi:MAG: hypothetical protein IPL08_12675 [Saprospiraceae bacterium]|nr:hypothetical protein [Saprospiraceae bacterium]
MIDLGLSHMQATGVLFLTNVLFIILAITLQDVGNLLLLSIIISLALIMSFFASWLVVKGKQELHHRDDVVAGILGWFG